MNKKERAFRRSYPGWKSDDEPIILGKFPHCDECGVTITNLSEKNYCVGCYNKISKTKNKSKAVDNLTAFARWCANIGSVMLFVGVFIKIWIDSDFINKFIYTGLFLFITANIIYAVEAIAEDFEKNKR